MAEGLLNDNCEFPSETLIILMIHVRTNEECHLCWNPWHLMHASSFIKADKCGLIGVTCRHRTEIVWWLRKSHSDMQQQRYQDLLGPRHHLTPRNSKSVIFVQKFDFDKPEKTRPNSWIYFIPNSLIFVAKNLDFHLKIEFLDKKWEVGRVYQSWLQHQWLARPHNQFMKRQISLRIKLNSICKRAKKLIILDFRIDHPTACILKGMEFKHRVSPNKFSPQALPSENLKKSANLEVWHFWWKNSSNRSGNKI